jgi:hypothetical protein
MTVTLAISSLVPKFPPRSSSARYYGTAVLSIFKNEATTVHSELSKKLEYENKGERWGTFGDISDKTAGLIGTRKTSSSDFWAHTTSVTILSLTTQ